MKTDGSVVAWGDKDAGGDCGELQAPQAGDQSVSDMARPNGAREIEGDFPKSKDAEVIDSRQALDGGERAERLRHDEGARIAARADPGRTAREPSHFP